MIKKRIIAHIIDIFIVAILTSIVFCLPVFESERNTYLDNTTKYQETYKNYTNNEAEADEVIESEYEMYHSSTMLLITKAGITILYFSIIPYYTNYKTIGKKLLKIQIAPIKGKEIKAGSFFARGLITSNVIFDITNIILILRLPMTIWQNYSLITNYLSYIVYLILLEGMIMNKDRRGLHDKIFNTKVIESK